MKRNWQQLEQKISVKFADKNLLKKAFVHRSYLNENPGFKLGHNERLEFLGDAVMELAVTEWLFCQYPRSPEGDLTNWRASLVNSQTIAQIARELNLESYLFLSRGEAKDKNSKARQMILANVFEALIGAIYLDQGMNKSCQFIEKNLLVKFEEILENHLYLDPKSKFQELAQEKLNITPFYQVLSEKGPDHKKVFAVGVYLEDKLVAQGQGSSKQEAQLAAAQAALAKNNWKLE